MENTIQITIPAEWLEGLSLDEGELRQVLRLGLAELRRQQAAENIADPAVQALLSTGRVRRLSVPLPEGIEPDAKRQAPLNLPGRLLSEIIIAMRRGEW